MNLRFIERDGRKILQFANKDGQGDSIHLGQWHDVPLVQEPRKAREFIVNPDRGVWSADMCSEIPLQPGWIRVREVLDEK